MIRREHVRATPAERPPPGERISPVEGRPHVFCTHQAPSYTPLSGRWWPRLETGGSSQGHRDSRHAVPVPKAAVRPARKEEPGGTGGAKLGLGRSGHVEQPQGLGTTTSEPVRNHRNAPADQSAAVLAENVRHKLNLQPDAIPITNPLPKSPYAST